VLRSQAGTQAFMAPEMFHYVPGLNPQSSEYTNAVDIWAIGCITYRILAGNPPFSDLWSLKTYCGDPKIPMPSKSGSLARAESFLGGLLMPHPDDRLTASHALQDPWLTSHLPDSSELVHDDYPPTHLTPLYTHFKNDPSDSKTVKLAVENSATQFHYNTGSHAGLRSYNEPSATPKGVPKPTEWPQADVQRMPEPMPHAFDLDKVGALALAEDIKPRATKRSEPRYDLSSEENEEKMANKPRINGKKYDDTNQRRYTGSSEEEVFVEENDDEFGDPPPPYRQTGLKSPDLNKQPKDKSRVSEDAISYSIENLSAQREPQPLLWLRKKLFVIISISNRLCTANIAFIE
jgi:serine/threonine protein kinase